MGNWYSLPAAQRKVGLQGTRGRRLLTFLRRAEREEKRSLVRETKTARGKIRREVNELTLLRLFPHAFQADLNELGLGGLTPGKVRARSARRSTVPTSLTVARSSGEAVDTSDAGQATRGRAKPF